MAPEIGPESSGAFEKRTLGRQERRSSCVSLKTTCKKPLKIPTGEKKNGRNINTQFVNQNTVYSEQNKET